MKKKELLTKFWSYLLCLLLFFESTNAFDGPTHGYITDKSFEYCCMVFHQLIDIIDEVKEVVHKFSLQPDVDENEGGYRHHFYNPATETNYADEKISALSRFITHYQNATNFYKKFLDYKKSHDSLNSGETEQKEQLKKNFLMFFKKAFQELGRAIHYLEDLNTPVHVVYETSLDAVVMFPLHIDFENKANILCKKIEIDFSKEFFEKNKQNNLTTIGHNSALLASENFHAYTEKHITQEEAISNAVSNGLKAVLGLLVRFFYDIKVLVNTKEINSENTIRTKVKG